VGDARSHKEGLRWVRKLRKGEKNPCPMFKNGENLSDSKKNVEKVTKLETRKEKGNPTGSKLNDHEKNCVRFHQITFHHVTFHQITCIYHYVYIHIHICTYIFVHNLGLFSRISYSIYFIKEHRFTTKDKHVHFHTGNVYIYIHIYIYCIFIYICIHAYIYVCTYLYVCIDIHICSLKQPPSTTVCVYIYT